MIHVRRLVLTALLLVAGAAHSQTYNLFRPANGILKGSVSTYVTTSAAATDVSGLWAGTCSNLTYLRGDGTCATPPGTGGGTVNSVGLTAPSVFSVSGSPVTSTGVLALTFAGGQTANQVLASPNGTTGAVALRSLVANDIPAIPLTTGVTGTLPVSNGGTGAATLTGPLKGNGTSALSAAASADIVGLWSGTCNSGTVLRGDGSCAAVGSVTSVGLTVPSGFSVSGSPVTGSGTLGITGTLNPAAGGTGVATITGPIKGNGTSAFSAAASTDIIGLWTSGVCSSSTYLRGDGSCQTPPGSGIVGANPTATVGLTAVNGSSGNFMRADGAPALDQGIAPTWTGAHIHSNTVRINSGLGVNTAPGATGTITSSGALSAGGQVTALSSGSSQSMFVAAVSGSNDMAFGMNASGSTNSYRIPNGAAGLGTFSGGNMGMYFSGSSTLFGRGLVQVDNTGSTESQVIANFSGADALMMGINLSGSTDGYRLPNGKLGFGTFNGGNIGFYFGSGGRLVINDKPVPVTAYAFVQMNGAITGSNTTAQGITSVSGPSPTGNYTVNFTGSYFSSAPACTASVSTSLLGAGVQVGNATTSGVVVLTYDNSTVPVSSNQPFQITCVGPN